MKTFPAFLTLIRWLNLFFIALTQVLFQYAVVASLVPGPSWTLGHIDFFLLCFSSVMIAAGGYVINDYFDVHIDKVNKPGRIVVDRYIARRKAIIWHGLFSLAGILTGFLMGYRTGLFWIGPTNVLCVALLWFYSTTFKKKLLSGNIMISLLTAWVVSVVGLASYHRLRFHSGSFDPDLASRLLRYTFLYAGFACIICLVREVVKDVEDMEGDRRYGCQTMPVLWGVQVSKVFAGSWLAMVTAGIMVVFAYVLQMGWWLAAAYALLLLLLPLWGALRALVRARSTADFRALSRRIKFIMLTGILSMLLFLT